MTFELDEKNNDEDYSKDDKEDLEETTKVAGHMFDNGIRANSKEQMKEMLNWQADLNTTPAASI